MKEQIDKVLRDLFITRQKLDVAKDTFPAYYCPKCKNTMADGIGAVVVDTGEELVAFCKWCFLHHMKDHCGVVQFTGTGTKGDSDER